MGIDEVMSHRFSCRAYEARAVPRAVLEQLLTMARTSPSWCNTQPWEVVLTSAEATASLRDGLKAHLADFPAPDVPFPETYTGVHLERRRACGWALYEACGIAKGDRAASGKQMLRNFELFDPERPADPLRDRDRLSRYERALE